MTAKEELSQIKKTMKYIKDGDVYYTPIYYEQENNILYIKKAKDSQRATKENTKTIEEARQMYAIQIQIGIVTPDKYFLWKIKDAPADILVRCLLDKRLINYMMEHKEECPEVVDTLIDIASNTEKWADKNINKVKKAAFETCKTLDLISLESGEIVLDEVLQKERD